MKRSKVQFIPFYRVVLSWAKHLNDYRESGALAFCDEFSVDRMAVACLRCAITLGETFTSWDEAAAYLTPHLSGYSLVPERLAGLGSPYSKSVGIIRAHIERNFRKAFPQSSGAPQEAESLMRALETVDRARALPGIDDIPNHGCSEQDAALWLHRHGTLDPQVMAGLTLSDRTLAYLERQGTKDRVAAALLEHWKRILETLPLDQDVSLVRAALQIYTDQMAATCRRLYGSISHMTDPFYHQAYAEVAWWHIEHPYGSPPLRNWVNAFKYVGQRIGWGSGFKIPETYQAFIATGKPVATIEEGFESGRNQFWLKRYPNAFAPKPDPTDIKYLLDAAEITSEEFELALGNFLNKPPPPDWSSHSSSSGKKEYSTLRGLFSRIREVLEKEDKIPPEEVRRADGIFIDLCCYLLAQAYGTGYSGTSDIRVREIHGLLAEVLVYELNFALSDGATFADWDAVLAYVVERHPSFRKYQTGATFHTGVLSGRGLSTNSDWRSLQAHVAANLKKARAERREEKPLKPGDPRFMPATLFERAAMGESTLPLDYSPADDDAMIARSYNPGVVSVASLPPPYYRRASAVASAKVGRQHAVSLSNRPIEGSPVTRHVIPANTRNSRAISGDSGSEAGMTPRATSDPSTGLRAGQRLVTSDTPSDQETSERRSRIARHRSRAHMRALRVVRQNAIRRSARLLTRIY